jgi:hypothetical protein
MLGFCSKPFRHSGRIAVVLYCGLWRGDCSDRRRRRWAVQGPTGCWTFPYRYGANAAHEPARRMNGTADPRRQTHDLANRHQ